MEIFISDGDFNREVTDFGEKSVDMEILAEAVDLKSILKTAAHLI